MPKVVRPMKRDIDGPPVVGTQSKELGVRVPPTPHADIELDYNGNVKLNGKGLSVASDWRFLPPHLIPKRFRNVARGATGSDSLEIYTVGEGEFQAAPINEHLVLILKSNSTQNGVIAPNALEPIEQFLTHLADTREQWVVGEING